MLDARADRLAFCQSVPGLHETVAAGDGLKERLAERTGGELFDLVFDATGHAGAMEQSFGWVAHAGTMVFVGIVRTEIRFSDPRVPQARGDPQGEPERHHRGTSTRCWTRSAAAVCRLSS